MDNIHTVYRIFYCTWDQIKEIYNRETNSAAFYVINKTNVYQTPLPFYATQRINPSIILANHKKGDEF